jgi:hypothetical protein
MMCRLEPLLRSLASDVSGTRVWIWEDVVM